MLQLESFEYLNISSLC